jgi:hypothetical protein
MQFFSPQARQHSDVDTSLVRWATQSPPESCPQFPL